LEEIKSTLTPEEIDLGKIRSRNWKNEFASAALLEFAAEDGDVIAQYILANSYWLGVVGFWHPDIKAEMLKWYSKSSAQGYSMAQYELGWHYLEGKRWQKDVTRALMLLRAAAKQGNVCAQEELGMIYFKGFDVAADFSQAYTWFVLAGADSSETKAALSQIRSKLSPVEIAQAEAAAKAFLITRNPLDDLGRVAIFDLEKSSPRIFQLRMEANNGNVNAQFELGEVYQKAQSLPGSRAMAYVWFNLAEARGHLLAKKLRDQMALEISQRILLLAQIVCREKIPAGDISSN
jgi:TPR repeat protein